MNRILLAMLILPLMVYAEPSTNEVHELMMPEEKEAARTIGVYRGTVAQAYYCMGTFPELSKQVANTLAKYQSVFMPKYEYSHLRLMQIIQAKKDVNAALIEHMTRIHASEKVMLSTLGSPGIPIPELCQQFATDPEAVMAVSYEFIAK